VIRGSERWSERERERERERNARLALECVCERERGIEGWHLSGLLFHVYQAVRFERCKHIEVLTFKPLNDPVVHPNVRKKRHLHCLSA
jgi:hypothetical protein